MELAHLANNASEGAFVRAVLTLGATGTCNCAKILGEFSGSAVLARRLLGRILKLARLADTASARLFQRKVTSSARNAFNGALIFNGGTSGTVNTLSLTLGRLISRHGALGATQSKGYIRIFTCNAVNTRRLSFSGLELPLGALVATRVAAKAGLELAGNTSHAFGLLGCGVVLARFAQGARTLAFRVSIRTFRTFGAGQLAGEGIVGPDRTGNTLRLSRESSVATRDALQTKELRGRTLELTSKALITRFLASLGLVLAGLANVANRELSCSVELARCAL